MEIRVIREEEYHCIVQWNKRTDADFLQQWAGPVAYTYPISESQIASRIDEGNDIYVVVEDEQVIGSFEYNINEVKKQAFLSRVIFDSAKRGMGYGTRAMSLLTKDIFEKHDQMNKIILHVYCFNEGAIKCYQKAHFEIVEESVSQNPKWNSYTMVCKRDQL